MTTTSPYTMVLCTGSINSVKLLRALLFTLLRRRTLSANTLRCWMHLLRSPWIYFRGPNQGLGGFLINLFSWVGFGAIGKLRRRWLEVIRVRCFALGMGRLDFHDVLVWMIWRRSGLFKKRLLKCLIWSLAFWETNRIRNRRTLQLSCVKWSLSANSLNLPRGSYDSEDEERGRHSRVKLHVTTEVNIWDLEG